MHRAIMVYGPERATAVHEVMNTFETPVKKSDLNICHNWLTTKGDDITLKTFQSFITDLTGRTSTQCHGVSYVVLHHLELDEIESNFPHPVEFVLTFGDGFYNLYAVSTRSLFDWFVLGGRWMDYLVLSPMEDVDIKSTYDDGTVPVKISDIDWDGILATKFPPITESVKLPDGVPSLWEFIAKEFPTIPIDRSHPYFRGMLTAMRWVVLFKYYSYLHSVEITHPALIHAGKCFWSSTTMDRIAANKHRILAGWIIDGILYDLDDLSQSEEHMVAGLDALEALPSDTHVTVVDIHN